MLHIIILVVLGIIYIKTRTYKKEEVGVPDKKEHPMQMLYPMSFWLLDRIKRLRKGSIDIFHREKLQAVYTTSNVEQISIWYSCRMISLIILIVLITNILAICIPISSFNRSLLVNERYLTRPEVNQNAEDILLDIWIDGEEEILVNRLLEVEARRYTEEEVIQVMKEVKKDLPEQILGDNENTERVSLPLNLITQIKGIQIEWETDTGGYVNPDGSIGYKDIKEEGIPIRIVANLSYREFRETCEISLVLFPKVYTKEEILIRKLEENLKITKTKSEEKDVWELPESVEGLPVIYEENKGNTSIIIIGLGLLILLSIPYLFSVELKMKLKKRNDEMMLDYPEIMNKFTLLLGAGMTIKGAWGKIVKEYIEKQKKEGFLKRYAYEELVITWNELLNGQMEKTAYERFGRRVKLSSYLRFSTLISQNLKKGNARLLSMLEMEAVEAFEIRKETMKRLGEEASSKLLIPMMIMLLLVLGIIIFPAMMTL